MEIKSRLRNYEVHFAANPIETIEKIPYRQYVVDSIVWQLHSNSLLNKLSRSSLYVLPMSTKNDENEKNKTLETTQNLYNYFIKYDPKRSITMVSIGGGFVQDVTGFVASTLYRGINWIYVPTTLLAQADSCIGSKTSLNFNQFKNVIGTFYPPSEVYIDTQFILTQTTDGFFSGLGEVLRLHIIGGASRIKELIDLFPRIIQRQKDVLDIVVKNSLMVKKEFIEDDEFDVGKRHFLNYGHALGHALEFASHNEISHGQAVVIGMILANIIAGRRNILSRDLENYLAKELLLRALIVEGIKRQYLNIDNIVKGLKMDKRQAAEGLVLIMMDDNFEPVLVHDLSVDEISYALNKFSELINSSKS